MASHGPSPGEAAVARVQGGSVRGRAVQCGPYGRAVTPSVKGLGFRVQVLMFRV
jgi:hypothetical protein